MLMLGHGHRHRRISECRTKIATPAAQQRTPPHHVRTGQELQGVCIVSEGGLGQAQLTVELTSACCHVGHDLSNAVLHEKGKAHVKETTSG